MKIPSISKRGSSIEAPGAGSVAWVAKGCCLFIVVFFCVSFFAGKWKGKSAARGMDLIDKKGTTVPNNRLSGLQHQFKIGTRPAAGAGGVGVEPPQQTPKRLSFAPLAAPVLITPGTCR